MLLKFTSEERVITAQIYSAWNIPDDHPSLSQFFDDEIISFIVDYFDQSGSELFSATIEILTLTDYFQYAPRLTIFNKTVQVFEKLYAEPNRENKGKKFLNNCLNKSE